MKEKTFRQELMKLTPEVPKDFHRRVETFLEEKVDGEVRTQETEKRAFRKGGRSGGRTLVFALTAILILSTVAIAATQWGIFDALGYYLGLQPPNADSVLQGDLHTETVNGVEIRVREAGYDGRTLFLQYSYRFPGSESEAGNKAGQMLTDEDLELFEKYGVGWWVDAFWIDGRPIEMATDSGSMEMWGDAGEIIRTDYWRLDNLNIKPKGKVDISMPIGEKQDAEYRQTIFDLESGQYRLPDKGTVTFSMDVGDTSKGVVTFYPEVGTVTSDVTAKVTEAAFTPLMTYITLELTPDPDALAEFRRENGDGYTDGSGNMLWSYTGIDVYGEWIASLCLVDGNGKEIFPETRGCNGMSETRAEFLYPYMDPDDLPEELWLAPMEQDEADMKTAIRVK